MQTLAYQVVALTFALINNGIFEDLIDFECFEPAIAQLKKGRCQDSIGLCTDAITNLDGECKSYLRDMLNQKANDTSLVNNEWHWNHVPAWLIPKENQGDVVTVGAFRPIHIITALQKLYLRCLYVLIKMH